MTRLPFAIALALNLLLVANTLAQPATPPAGAATQAKDLAFPSKPSRASFSSPEMAVYKPDGPGPFPALVLYHECSGLGEGRAANASMLDWAKESVTRGYVVLLIDSLGPRGVKTVCMGPQRGVTFARGVKDAFQAGDHLRTLDFVHKDRVAIAGYSWGAMVATLVSSRQWASVFGTGTRFAAAVAFYPGCFTIRPPTIAPYEIVNPDIDRPLLVMTGGRDTETPAAECAAKLDPIKASGAPVELHLYPDATHCWDCSHRHDFTKTDARGNQVVYRYDKDVTADSARRMFEFLDKTLKR